MGFADPPAGQGLSRYSGQKLTWQTCAGSYQCAEVLAPLDYAAPDGTALTLALAKRSATKSPRLGTLFINPGGPGASGVQLIRDLKLSPVDERKVYYDNAKKLLKI